MDGINARFRVIGRMFDSSVKVFAAKMENFAAELTEATKSFPEREYWRGYADAMSDTDDIKRAKEEHIDGR